MKARHNAGVAVRIVSVSLGGARLHGEITVQLGERIRVLFEVDGRPIDTDCEVVRVEKVDMATDKIAIRFIDVDATTKIALRHLVDRLLEMGADEAD